MYDLYTIDGVEPVAMPSLCWAMRRAFPWPSLHAMIMFLANWLGARAKLESVSPVIGLVVFPALSHVSIDLRSYVIPSLTHVTGSRMISRLGEIGRGWTDRRCRR